MDDEVIANAADIPNTFSGSLLWARLSSKTNTSVTINPHIIVGA